MLAESSPRCLELFAGSGGAALGIEAAGFAHAALCEWDADACATLRAAGLGPVVEGDVRDLDAIEAVAGSGPLDLLWSSFPCQAFSTAGKRKGASDERNGWPWTVDAIDRFRPGWFLAENVRGLLCHSSEGHPDPMRCPRCYLDEVILPQLRERFAHAGWWLLDAADYGVPQHRRRVILWAGPRPLAPPEPTHADPATLAQRSMFGPRLAPWVTPDWWPSPCPAACATEWKGHTNPDVERGRANPINRASDAWYLATGERVIPVAEAARVQGFPADHPWPESMRAALRSIGNAVPPTLARVVAARVYAELTDR
jgi:DNA (cytosine-5)-methyltransferase 1